MVTTLEYISFSQGIHIYTVLVCFNYLSVQVYGSQMLRTGDATDFTPKKTLPASRASFCGDKEA